MSAAQAERWHLLVVEARFYDEIADLLLAGARRALAAAGATFETATVPGAPRSRRRSDWPSSTAPTTPTSRSAA